MISFPDSCPLDAAAFECAVQIMAKGEANLDGAVTAARSTDRVQSFPGDRPKNSQRLVCFNV